MQGRARLVDGPCWPGSRQARQHLAWCRGYARQSPPPRRAMLARNTPGKAASRPVPGLRKAEPAFETGHAGQEHARQGSTPPGAGATQGRARLIDGPCSGGGRRVRAAYVSPFAGKGRHIRCGTAVLSAAFWGLATGPTCELRGCRRVLLRQPRDEHGWRLGSLRDPDGPCPAWEGPMAPCWPRPPLASGRGTR